MFANVLVNYFEAGGPVMWPILVTALVAVAVVGERAWWWWRESLKRDPATLEKVFAAIEGGDFKEASRLSKGSEDAVIRMIWHGMNHHHSSLQGALQVAAGAELQKAGRFLTVMDTLVTLAPLLGLLGTVAGIFRTFLSIGGAASRARWRKSPAASARRSSPPCAAWSSPFSRWFPSIISAARSRHCS